MAADRQHHRSIAMNTSFTVVHKRFPGYDEIAFSGIVDAKADALLSELPDKVSSPLVKCNFHNVGRINSMGIALLLRCFKRIRDEHGAEIRITALTSVNAMLFKMTGVFLLANKDGEEPT
jgi:anti-anti-sigma regulatory factor